MSIGKIELSVGAIKIADKYELFTEEEIDAINNKIPELDERVGVVEDEIDAINNKIPAIEEEIDAINNKIPELDERVGVIEDEIEEINSSLDNKVNKEETINYSSLNNNLSSIIKSLQPTTLKTYNNRTYFLSTDSSLKGSTRVIYDQRIEEELGFIDNIVIDCKVGGTIKIKILERTANDFEFKFLNEEMFELKVGLNILTPKTLFVKKFDCIAFFSDTAEVFYKDYGNGIKYLTKDGDNCTNSAPVVGGFTLAENKIYSLFWRVVSISKDNKYNNYMNYANMLGEVQNNKYNMRTEYFKTIPSDFNNVLNNFELDNVNGGVKPKSTVGGLSSRLVWNVYTTLDKQTIRARILLTNGNTRFALCTQNDIYGSIAEVDFLNLKLKLYKPWVGGAFPNVVVEKAFDGIGTAEGREYVVQFDKDGSKYKLTLFDAVRRKSTSVEFDNSTVSASGYVSKMWGMPGVMNLRGNFTVKKFEFISGANKYSKVLILGDSITEGYGLDSGLANYDDRWCVKIRELLFENCAISGRGSGDTTDLLTRLDFNLDKFNPKYVILAIGTNDVILKHDIVAFKTNIDKIIARVESKNAIPILVCPPTNQASNMPELKQIYDYIKAKPYPVINFQYATSVNNDGITQDETLFQSDKTHPNKLGNEKMFEQVLIDVREIFE